MSLVSELAEVPLDDGVEFRTDTATSRIVRVTLTPRRAGMEPVRVLGYPAETACRKLRRPSTSDQPNTCVRDYAHIYTLTGIHVIKHRTARRALLATAAHQETSVQPLSAASAASQTSDAKPTTRRRRTRRFPRRALA